MSKKLKPRDKVTQKMSRDGLIEVNETAGTAELVSGREQDADFSKQPEQAAQEAAQQLPHPSGGAAARPHTPELSPKRDDAAAERWRIQILTSSAWKTDSSMRSTAFPPITCSIMTRVAISWTLRLLPSRPFASMYLRLIRTQLSS